MSTGEGLIIKRNNAFDLLRIISSFMVVLIHVNANFLTLEIEKSEYGGVLIAEHLLNYISRFSVPVFIMLSGAFLLDCKDNCRILPFWKKYIRKLLPLLCVVVSCGFFYHIWMFFHRYISLVQFAHSMLTFGYWNLWFMPLIIMLYLITPFLVHLKNSLGLRSWRRFCVVFFIWAVLSQLIWTNRSIFSVGLFFSYVGYFVIGNAIADYKYEKMGSEVRFIICFCILILSAVTVFFRVKGLSYFLIDPQLAFFSPSVVIYSILMFILFKNLDIKKSYLKVSKKTYGIYLFHTPVLLILKYFGFLNVTYDGTDIIRIIVITVFCFLVSYFVTDLLSRILGRWFIY